METVSASYITSSARWTANDEYSFIQVYLSKVTVVVECPRISLSVLILKPTSTARVANVCRSV